MRQDALRDGLSGIETPLSPLEYQENYPAQPGKVILISRSNLTVESALGAFLIAILSVHRLPVLKTHETRSGRTAAK